MLFSNHNIFMPAQKLRINLLTDPRRSVSWSLILLADQSKSTTTHIHYPSQQLSGRTSLYRQRDNYTDNGRNAAVVRSTIFYNLTTMETMLKNQKEVTTDAKKTSKKGKRKLEDATEAHAGCEVSSKRRRGCRKRRERCGIWADKGFSGGNVLRGVDEMDDEYTGTGYSSSSAEQYFVGSEIKRYFTGGFGYAIPVYHILTKLCQR